MIEEIAPKPILYKRQMVELYLEGVFGNHSPTWRNISEWLIGSPLKGLAHIRSKVTSGQTWYNIPCVEVYKLYKEIVAQGLIRPEDAFFSLMAPTEKTLFQCEVERSNRHLNLFYSTLALPMREALTIDGKQAYGIQAALLLRSYLCPNSYDWLTHLLDVYEDHVIELSTYSCCWGTVPNFNTVFWEIRCGY